MKKWFTIFLLLVIVTAMLYPCCDKDKCCDDSLTAKATERNNNKPQGTCSPFITCGTCTGFIQMTRLIEISFAPEVKPAHHSHVISVALPDYTASLLQPPRVA